ncbi:MAG: DUF3187 family protein [Gammaproteobacteria bacterium]|nr:MAG: DUF3187 family protein [Gammaproteobacteria bacterium]
MLLLLLVALPAAVFAQALNDQDNGPLTGIFGFPNSMEGATLADAGRNAWNVSSMLSSHAIIQQTADERLQFDGQTTRLALTYRRGISDRLELGIELPYLWHEYGNLDSFIDGWHDFFGLPNGVRTLQPQDQIEFSYADAAGEQLGLSRSVNGVGDLRLLGGWRLAGSGDSSTALRFNIKLPTGDSARLLGSGGTDFSIGIAGDYESLWGMQRLSGFYRLSGTRLGTPDILRDRYRRFVARVSGGVGYRLNDVMTIRAQVTLRSAAFDSGIGALGNNAAMLAFGADFRLSEKYALAIGVIEDINVTTAPDVTFTVTLDRRGT